MTAPAAVDKSKAYFPLAGLTNDGWSTESEATATCFCSAVQLAFVSLAPESAHQCTREHARGLPFPSHLSPNLSISSALIPHPNS